MQPTEKKIEEPKVEESKTASPSSNSSKFRIEIVQKPKIKLARCGLFVVQTNPESHLDSSSYKFIKAVWPSSQQADQIEVRK